MTGNLLAKKHLVTGKLVMHSRHLWHKQLVPKSPRPLKKQRQQDCSGRQHDDNECKVANDFQKCTR